jgi:RNA polymerase sigma factor (sigma-70 family)
LRREKADRFHCFAVDLYRQKARLPNASALKALENAEHRRIVEEQGGPEKTAELLQMWKASVLNQLPENDFSLALAKAGDKQAMNRVVSANLGLAAVAVKNFSRLRAPRGMTPQDVGQSAIIHLHGAVQNFDFTLGYRFGTFAITHIYNSLCGEWRDAGMIRVPRTMREKQSKLEKAETQLKLRLGRKPSDDEVADLMKIMPSVLAELRNANTDPASLDAPVPNRGRGTVELGSLIPEKTSIGANLEIRALTGASLRGLSTLPERQQFAIRAMTLLPYPAPSSELEHKLNALIKDRDEPPTQAEAASHLGISESRFSQYFRDGKTRLRKLITEQGWNPSEPKKKSKK